MNQYLISSLEQQLKKDPGSRVFFRLAEEYRKGGVYEKAASICSEGIRNHPNYLPAHVCLGRCYSALKRLDEAEAAFMHVLDLAPDNLHALRGMATISFDQGRFKESQRFLEILLMYEPGDQEATDKLKMIVEATEPAADGPFTPQEMAPEPAENVLSDEAPEPPPLPEAPASESATEEALDDLLDEPMGLSDADLAAAEVEDLPGDALQEEPPTLLKDEALLEDEAHVSEQEEMEELDTFDLADFDEDDDVQEEEHTLVDSPTPAASEPLDIDLEFEKALAAPDTLNEELLAEAQLAAEAKAPVPKPPVVQDANTLNTSDEQMLTQGLKHEKMEHFEAAQHIYRNLLHKYPGNSNVAGHHQRVKTLMAREDKQAKKIRLLNNWLDKIKGVYHVR